MRPNAVQRAWASFARAMLPQGAIEERRNELEMAFAAGAAWATASVIAQSSLVKRDLMLYAIGDQAQQACEEAVAKQRDTLHRMRRQDGGK